MSHNRNFCDYGMARPLTVIEAASSIGFSRQHLYRLLKSGAIKHSSTTISPIDGTSLLNYLASRKVSIVPGTNILTYSLRGLIAASGRGRSYVLKMVEANNIRRFYILFNVHFEKSECDVAMRKEDPLCR